MRKIRLLKPAEQEFHDARTYYEDHQAGLGEQFTAAVEEKLRSIRENPELDAITYSDVREAIVGRFPYVIYFTLTDETVDVWAVFHQSRDPAEWQSRLEE